MSPSRGTKGSSSIVVDVVRRRPSGETETFSATIDAPRHQKTIEFMFEVNGYEDFGSNIFSVNIDAANVVEELPAKAETNNRVLNYDVFIGNPVVLPVYPKKFAIVKCRLIFNIVYKIYSE